MKTKQRVTIVFDEKSSDWGNNMETNKTLICCKIEFIRHVVTCGSPMFLYEILQTFDIPYVPTCITQLCGIKENGDFFPEIYSTPYETFPSGFITLTFDVDLLVDLPNEEKGA